MEGIPKFFAYNAPDDWKCIACDNTKVSFITNAFSTISIEAGPWGRLNACLDYNVDLALKEAKDAEEVNGKHVVPVQAMDNGNSTWAFTCENDCTQMTHNPHLDYLMSYYGHTHHRHDTISIYSDAVTIHATVNFTQESNVVATYAVLVAKLICAVRNVVQSGEVDED